jgi:hypothetical protein
VQRDRGRKPLVTRFGGIPLTRKRTAVLTDLKPIMATVKRARAGSKRRSIHSHSWQSRKKVRVAVRLCALVRGEIGVPVRAWM